MVRLIGRGGSGCRVCEAKAQTEKPSIIIMRTTIGCGSGPAIEGRERFRSLDCPWLAQLVLPQ